MITIRNVRGLDDSVRDFTIDSDEDQVIDAEGRLVLLPALVDTHVHFRTPGHEHKEDWKTAAAACVRGGVTRVFDMPNNNPPCTTEKALYEKKNLIDAQLKEAGIPLRYNLYFGADSSTLEQLAKVRKEVIGLKIYMGSSTGGLVMDDESSLDRAFQLAAQENVLVAVHAEDEEILKANAEAYKGQTDPSVHSKVRDREAAIRATEHAIRLAEKYDAQLLICHVSTAEELELIRQAKKRGLLVYAEVCTHHLFLSEGDYKHLQSYLLVNPPVRTVADQEALWRGINDGTVDFIGTDHAPHTIDEKEQPYGKAPSGLPGVETLLPLLLNAAHNKKVSLDRIVSLTHVNAEQIFSLERNQDFVLVDLEMEKAVSNADLKTKCRWSPYDGMVLKGWPVYTILEGKVYSCF
jgi:dihydroorotase